MKRVRQILRWALGLLAGAMVLAGVGYAAVWGWYLMAPAAPVAPQTLVGQWVFDTNPAPVGTVTSINGSLADTQGRVLSIAGDGSYQLADYSVDVYAPAPLESRVKIVRSAGNWRLSGNSIEFFPPLRATFGYLDAASSLHVESHAGDASRLADGPFDATGFRRGFAVTGFDPANGAPLRIPPFWHFMYGADQFPRDMAAHPEARALFEKYGVQFGPQSPSQTNPGADQPPAPVAVPVQETRPPAPRRFVIVTPPVTPPAAPGNLGAFAQ